MLTYIKARCSCLILNASNVQKHFSLFSCNCFNTSFRHLEPNCYAILHVQKLNLLKEKKKKKKLAVKGPHIQFMQLQLSN
jgi:hypothetical protein